jgi:DNA invertase Pin-like site-specific DNA recombinase
MITGSIRVSTSEQKKNGKMVAFYLDNLRDVGVAKENIFMELARSGSMDEDKDINYRLDDGKFWIGFDLKRNRPDLYDWLLNKVSKGMVEKHFLIKWDRWARNTILGLALKNYCKSKGCTVEALQDGNDDKLVPIILMFAEYEGQADKKRVHNFKQFMFDNGLSVGTKDKYGYKKVKIEISGKKFNSLEIIDTMIPVIREIFRNDDYKDCCQKLNISKTTYYSVRHDKFYAGYITYKDQEKLGIHNPMISLEDWKRVN